MKILDMKLENCPKTRFIGKRYLCSNDGVGNWEEWWTNGWFEILEKIPCLEINDNGYIGAMHIVNGYVEYWIGMFYSIDTIVPEGFEYIDIQPLNYAVFYLYGNPNSGELFGLDAHNKCLEEINSRGLKRKEDDWCFERYNCPRYTIPDENGNVILDYAISIEKTDEE